MSAPRITPEDEEREKKHMSDTERAIIEADVTGCPSSYGVPSSDSSSEQHVPCRPGDVLVAEDDPHWVDELLASFDSELDMIRPERKAAVLAAAEGCPELVSSPKRRMQFLRSEDYDPRLAADRMVRYWEKRLDLFGPLKAFVPLTIDDALGVGEIRALRSGEIRFLGLDDAGRAILYKDHSFRPSSAEEGYGTDELMRALFYLMNAMSDAMDEAARDGGAEDPDDWTDALEEEEDDDDDEIDAPSDGEGSETEDDEESSSTSTSTSEGGDEWEEAFETDDHDDESRDGGSDDGIIGDARWPSSRRPSGFVVVANETSDMFDRKIRMKFFHVTECAALSFKGGHACFPQSDPFSSLLIQLLKFIVGRFFRHRIVVHRGTKEETLEELLSYGVSCPLPKEIGGDLTVDSVGEWLAERWAAGL